MEIDLKYILDHLYSIIAHSCSSVHLCSNIRSLCRLICQLDVLIISMAWILSLHENDATIKLLFVAMGRIYFGHKICRQYTEYTRCKVALKSAYDRCGEKILNNALLCACCLSKIKGGQIINTEFMDVPKCNSPYLSVFIKLFPWDDFFKI